MNTYKIILSENESIEVPAGFVKLSNTFTNLISDVGDEDNELPAPTDTLSAEILKKMVSVFERTNKLKFQDENYIDVLRDKFSKLKEDYADNNLPLPEFEAFQTMEKSISVPELKSMLNACGYLDMPVFQRICGIIYSVKIKKLSDVNDYNEKVRIFTHLRVKIGHITKGALKNLVNYQ